MMDVNELINLQDQYGEQARYQQTANINQGEQESYHPVKQQEE